MAIHNVSTYFYVSVRMRAKSYNDDEIITYLIIIARFKFNLTSIWLNKVIIHHSQNSKTHIPRIGVFRE
jgi:hypothetical protein